MSRYRRNFIAGGTSFFTVKLADPKSHLLVEHIDLLHAAYADWTLPPDDAIRRKNHPPDRQNFNNENFGAQAESQLVRFEKSRLKT